jgi:hypothetical protein
MQSIGGGRRPHVTVPSASSAKPTRAEVVHRFARIDGLTLAPDAGRDLRAALLLQTRQTQPTACREMREEAAKRLIEEELRARAAARHAVGHAGHAHVGGLRRQIHALDGARQHLEAPERRALAAVERAVDARLVGALALAVPAHRTDAAVRLAARARLGRGAHPVAAPFALAAIGGARIAILGRRLTRPVAAGFANAAVGRTALARLVAVALAVAALRADAAILRARRAALGALAQVVAAVIAHPAVDRARRATFARAAHPITAPRRRRRCTLHRGDPSVVGRVVERRSIAAASHGNGDDAASNERRKRALTNENHGFSLHHRASLLERQSPLAA